MLAACVRYPQETSFAPLRFEDFVPRRGSGGGTTSDVKSAAVAKGKRFVVDTQDAQITMPLATF